jgi:Nucleoside-diphosphate-sugar pyrophosphorylase involved in lipopolysaccharide biosynthesis/translation initiation factor 2B, gamma/epsilon subunits (eIF-2Bgamma/eIF-2Bepsilon)
MRKTNNIVSKNINFYEALTKISETGIKTLIILNKNKSIYGIITEGSIRKQILKGVALSSVIEKYINKDFKFLYFDKIQKINLTNMFAEKKYEILPVVDKNKKFKFYLEWSDYLKKKEFFLIKENNLPVVIMSGGKGVRMKPISITIPKPLIPFKEKTVIEAIIDNFKEKGFANFNFILNHKSNLVKNYLNSVKKNLKFKFFMEKEPLGTAGGLSLLKREKFENFILTNCDTITKSNINDIIEFHKSKKNDMTLVAAIKDFQFPIWHT